MDRRPRVMVVDDEDRIRRLMEAYLSPWGYDIVLARDGRDALEKIQEEPPDLILMDVMMPTMDGLEATRRLKADDNTRLIPIVMVTALGDLPDRVRAMEAGADDFLSKPVEKIELRARVKSLLKVKAYNDHMKHYRHELELTVAERTRALRDAFRKLETYSLETVFRLTRAAEYKDEDTSAHIQRMSHYSSALVRRLGFGEKAAKWVLYAAPLHDIGKIGIPDRILLKPGKLDADEWTIMKQHTLYGAKILEGARAGYLRLGEVVALTHHERWDGTGYPRGLRGSQIPRIGQIVAIADVFDALTTRRPYKEAFSLELSLEIITQSRGSHFDPEIVDLFLSMKDEILTIKETFNDDALR
ncbi:MAG: HD domain-containing phosphohydrolase [Pseudomonadota bacterium]